MKYKIGYVDEDESDISRFYHKFIKKYDERYQNSKLYLLEDADHVFENNVEKAAQLGIDFFNKLKAIVIIVD